MSALTSEPGATGAGSLARAMRTAAARVLAALPPGERDALVGPFEEAELREWTYLPGRRPGLALGSLTEPQRQLALDLLHTAFSWRGVADLQLVMRTEEIGRELAAGRPLPDAHRDPPYWLRLLGSPDDAQWAWRVSGHHLVAQATVVGDDVALTPQFFGAEPARVHSGLHTGFQSLPRERDLAVQLVSVLEEDQRSIAIASTTAPSDIATRHDPVVRDFPAQGLRRDRMDRRQGDLLDTLIRQYLDRAPAPVADQAWQALVDAGAGEIRFSWFGGLAVGAGHYYAVSGPTFLLEYDNTQDDANHVHSVWRDLRRDFGADLLAAHHAAHHRPEDRASG